jgi:hypothetical protein
VAFPRELKSLVVEGCCLGSTFEVKMRVASIGIVLLTESDVLAALHWEDDETFHSEFSRSH